MCGTLTTKCECRDCSEVVSTSTDSLKCTKATFWGSCGCITSDSREVSKRADKICKTCEVKKDVEERRKRLEAATRATAARDPPPSNY